MNISIIIPTFQRENDLRLCLDALLLQNKAIHQLIIVDNWNSKGIENLVNDEKYKKIPILYHCSVVNSWAQARNRWIEHLLPDTDIVLFIDDDTTFWIEFLWEIESFFINNSNANGWVAHIDSPSRNITVLKKIWFILLTWSTKWHRQFVTKWWFNALPFYLSAQQQLVEWTSWCSMFFRKNIFDNWFRFPQKFLKYSLMEDCFLSYAIHSKYPWTLYYVPSIKIIHNESQTGRVANRAKIMQNIVHRYLFVKEFKLSLLAYYWTIFLLGLFDLVSYKSLQVFKYYKDWLLFIYNNKKEIMNKEFDYNKFIFAK